MYPLRGNYQHVSAAAEGLCARDTDNTHPNITPQHDFAQGLAVILRLFDTAQSVAMFMRKVSHIAEPNSVLGSLDTYQDLLCVTHSPECEQKA